jgi:long-chain acyl-CoA synthetase
MKSSDALLQAWDETLSRKNGAPAIFDTDGEVLHTFGEVEERARALDGKIDMFEASDVVGLQIGNHKDWPSLLLACLRRNLIALPLEQSMGEQQRDEALAICKASGVVAAAVSGGKDFKILPLRTAAATTWQGNPPSLLKLTSGTTATPRAIRFRSEQLVADCGNICDSMGIRDVDLNFGVIPFSHSYGLNNLITPLIVRGVPFVVSRDRLPRAVLDDLARTGATVFPGMPVFFQAFCEMENVPALPRLRLCISAGAPLTSTIARKFYEKFKQPLHSFYGSSECGGICYDRDGKDFEDGFVGSAMKHVDLEVIDLAAGSSQARVRSAAVGDGYFPEPDEQKMGNGVFVPDDLLMKHGSGFKIVGRISDVINVAGKKLHPAEVETALLRFEGVREAIVFGLGSTLRNEEIVACIVANANVREAELLEFCRRQLGGWQSPKRIFFVNAIPVNERGKISRRDLAKHFAAR